MFDSKYEHPIELFSTQHLVALAVIFAVILILFFCRKFFIKYKILDMVFRYCLVFMMLFFELYIKYRSFDGSFSVIGDKVLSPRALCSHLIWFSSIALLSNSDRIMKMIYPATLTGALMSLIFVDMNCSFPHYRAFQFFLTHAGFLIGSLYFVFTRKINRYTFKDLFNSCLFIFGMSLFSVTLSYTTGSDQYFIFRAPGPLGFITDALGQVGYTIVYLILILLVQLAIGSLTYLGTKNRKEEDKNVAKVAENKAIQTLAKFTKQQRLLYLFFVVGLTIYNSALLNRTKFLTLGIFDIILTLVLVASFVVYEVLINYDKQTLLNIATTQETNNLVLEVNNVKSEEPNIVLDETNKEEKIEVNEETNKETTEEKVEEKVEKVDEKKTAKSKNKTTKSKKTKSKTTKKV